MTTLRRFVLAMLVVLSFPLAAEELKLTLGVLSYRPKIQAQAQWENLTTHLNATVKNARFTLKVFDLPELQEAIRLQSVDVVITQPAEYVRMVHQNGLSSPLATLIQLEQGKPVRALGGVILTLSQRQDIQTLKDLANALIAAPSRQSFAGYQVQAFEFKKQNITMGKLIETGMAQDLAIDAVLSGQADAAFVRTGLLEAMVREGKLQLGQFKVINDQLYAGYPYALSTPLFPEWPVVAMSHVPDEVSSRIAGSLLSLPHGGALAQSMGIYGFTTPADYEPVRDLMRALRVSPFDNATRVTLSDIWEQYKALILTLSVTLLAILILGTRESILRQRMTSFGNAMGEGMYVLDDKGQATYVNRAAGKLLGYAPSDLIGTKLLGKIVAPFQPGRSSANNTLLTDPKSWPYPFQGESSFVNAQGTVFPVELSCQPVLRKGKLIRTVTVFSDISERKAQNEQVYQLAYFDVLTGLPNRRLLFERLELAIEGSTPMLSRGALLFSDLDRFKQLNDTLGHRVGDLLLQSAAQRFKAGVGDAGTLSHTGGDEFAILLTRLDTNEEVAAQQANQIAEKMLALMNTPFEIEGQRYSMTVSIGVATFSGNECSAGELLKRADIAMYQAKTSGRNLIRFFDNEIASKLKRQMELEADLHMALQNNEFEVFYQPQVNAHLQIVGAEALVRWHHPRRGMVMPGEFIPLAEENGLILPLGQWVLETACRQIVSWSNQPATEHLIVSVNLCAHQIFQPGFVANIESALRSTGANPHRLQLELTESVLAKNINDVIAKMNQIVAMGVAFSLDDFGTGFSSLNYLKLLPLHELKIDASFVRDLLSDPNDVAITQTIIALGQSLDLKVIAEGVETEAQCDVLRRQGCHLFQGYLFGRPQSVSGLTEHIMQSHPVQTH